MQGQVSFICAIVNRKFLTSIFGGLLFYRLAQGINSPSQRNKIVFRKAFNSGQTLAASTRFCPSNIFLASAVPGVT